MSGLRAWYAWVVLLGGCTGGLLIAEDVRAPEAPDTTRAGAIVLTRWPWGDGRGGPARGEVRGAAGSVEAGAVVTVEQDDGLFLARGDADADGGFGPITIGAGAPATLRVRAGDADGNTSSPSAIHDVEVVVRFAETPAAHAMALGSIAATATLRPADDVLVESPGHAALLADAEDERVLEVSARPVWRRHREGPSPAPRIFHQLAYDAWRGHTLLMGGDPGSSNVMLGDLWSWDGARWTELRPTGPRPPARGAHAMAFDPRRGELLVFGGTRDNIGWLADTWIWDGTAWRAVDVPGPPARSDAAMVYDPRRDRMVLFGGWALDGVLGDTWEWDGQAWNQLDASGAPAPRRKHQMVYDPRDGRVLMVGGENEQAGQKKREYHDTWAWDGRAWAQLAVDSAPFRTGAPLVVLPADGRVAMIGGTEPPTGAGDSVRVWSGTSWDEAPELRLPFKYKPYSAAVDAARAEVVLFGGRDETTTLGSTWILHGGRWLDSSTSTVTPPPRFRATLAYDERRAKLVLFGGSTALSDGDVLDDTWLWNGYHWRRASSAVTPGGRRGAAAVFHRQQDEVIMFGGYTPVGDTRLGDTWAWSGESWRRVSVAGALKPAARVDSHLLYREAVGQAQLVGGNGGFGFASNTDALWGWDGVGWIANPTPPWFAMASDPVDAAHDRARDRWVFGASTNDGLFVLDVDTTITASVGFGANCFLCKLAYFEPMQAVLLVGVGRNEAAGAGRTEANVTSRWDGQRLTPVAVWGETPRDVERAQVVSAPDRDAVLVYGEPVETSELWSLTRARDQQPSVQVGFDLGAGGLPLATLISLGVAARAEGRGFTEGEPDAELLSEAWDPRKQGWVPLGALGDVVAQTPQQVLMGPGLRWLWLRWRPRGGPAVGAETSMVRVDDVEVVARYRRP
jgi:hypothetical protein